jgi:hypothetical protein
MSHCRWIQNEWRESIELSVLEKSFVSLMPLKHNGAHHENCGCEGESSADAECSVADRVKLVDLLEAT